MDARRFVMQRAERLMEVSVRDQFWEASGKMSESVEITESVLLEGAAVVIPRL